MKHTSIAAGLALSAALAGCGGAGSGSPTPTTPGAVAPPTATAPPSSAPAPTSPPSSTAALSTATVNGSPGFVTPKGFATYFFDGDTTPDQSACTGGCLAVWPAVSPPAGVTITAPWSTFTRTDTGTVQLAYNGKPLYTFVSDTSPDVATGDGIQGFSIARPAASAATPAPTAVPTPYAVRSAVRKH